jgi:hypothetical protein
MRGLIFGAKIRKWKLRWSSFLTLTRKIDAINGNKAFQQLIDGAHSLNWPHVTNRRSG